jgi:flagellar biosynthetic protein FliR
MSSFAVAENFVYLFVLVFFRTAGLMLAAPLFGSSKIPRRVKVMLALVMAAGLVNGVAMPARMPTDVLLLTFAIGGELIFGLIMGLGLSLTFIAISWAGEIMGQQMGFNLAESFDPAMGSGGSLVGDLYFMLTLVIFMFIGGHRAMVLGLAESFKTLPLLQAGLSRDLFDLFASLLTAATVLAVKVAAPMLVTMLVVDVALGFLGKTVPQINVMNAGLTLRSGLGIGVLVVGLILTSEVMRQSLFESVERVTAVWTSKGAATGG